MLPRDSHAPRGHALAGTIAARRDEGRRQAAEIAEAGREPEKQDPIAGGRMELDHVLWSHGVQLGDRVEVRSVGAAVPNLDLDRGRLFGAAIRGLRFGPGVRDSRSCQADRILERELQRIEGNQDRR